MLVVFLFIMRCTAWGEGGHRKTDASLHYRGLKLPIMSEYWLSALGLPPVVKQAAAYLFSVLVMWFSKNKMSKQKRLLGRSDLIHVDYLQ